MDSQRMERELAPSTAMHGIGATVIPVFFLAFMIPVRGLDQLFPFLPAVPYNTLAGIGLIGFAAFHRARWHISMPVLSVASSALVASVLLSSALLQSNFEVRRGGTFAVILFLAAFVGSGRLHVDSLRRGLLWGISFGVLSGIIELMLGQSSYAGRLTGPLGDPNGVGFVVLAIGLAVAQGMKRQRDLVLLMLGMGITIWLTQSRTSMFAFAIALLWVFFGRRLGQIAGAIALVVIVRVFQWAMEYAEQQGWFVERLGSDNLRERLAEAEVLLTETAGWWGHGLGTAQAEFDGVTLFFHNSYRALQTEGGLIALVLLILVGVSLFWNFQKLPSHKRPVWAEAAIIAACICSFNIGYSLTTVSMGMCVGLYLAYHCQAREELQPEADAHVR